jgi:hypothetical protein
MNREQRRHPERASRPPDEQPPAAPVDEMRDQSRQQDDLSARAKSSGHGKKTADKWNQ